MTNYIDNIYSEAISHILSNIFKISVLLTKPASIDQVLNTIMQTVKEELGFNRCSVYFINEEKGTLECKFITGFTPAKERFVTVNPFNLQRHDCIETRVAKTGEPILVRDFFTDPRMTSLDINITRNMGRGRTLYVPLNIKGKVIGILGVDKRQGEPEITNEEIASLYIFASYASIVIENSRLYEALLNEKKLSENILKSSATGIFSTDVEGNITSLNPAAEKILGINDTDKSRLGASIYDVFETIPGVVKVLRSIVMNHENIEGNEFTFKRRGGQNSILSMTSSSIYDDKQNVIGILFTIQDITNIRDREKYLQRVNRLISLGEMAAGVAHEVRNPLTGIRMVLDILRGRPSLSGDDVQLTEEATLEIDRLEKIVRNLLDFARPKDFIFESSDINEVVDGISFLIRKQCKDQDVKLNIMRDEKIPRLRIDREKIKQGILNVAINAIQSMQDGGTLRIETRYHTEEKNVATSQRVSISISDTGKGIPEDVKDRIFDPFFTTQNEGTGLGLSITHSIIKEHNGTIDVVSQEGVGTELTISLLIE